MLSRIIYNVENVGSIEFGLSAPLYLLKFDGTAVSPGISAVNAIGKHGQIVLSKFLGPRTISTQIGVLGISNGRYSQTELCKLKNEILRILNPLNVGTLLRVNESGTYQIRCRVSESPKFEHKLGAYEIAGVDFIADDPFWTVANPKIHTIASSGTVSLNNDTGIEQPLTISGTIPGNSTFILNNLTTGQTLRLVRPYNFDRRFTLDTSDCQVYAEDYSHDMVRANFIFSYDSDVDMKLGFGLNKLDFQCQGTPFELNLAVHERVVGVS